MERSLLAVLLKWKFKSERKPLLIDGARQTGKTYLLQELFGQHFPRVVRIDFLEKPEFKEAFDGSLSPLDILANLELLVGHEINYETDLLIFDEIGECARAVTSLKYFAEKGDFMYIAASGSNIGLLNSFPVGKVEHYNLRPFTFDEFLLAAGEPVLLKAYREQKNSTVVHTKLLNLLTDYYYTGGMPEAVKAWFNTSGGGLLERINAVSQIHSDLVNGYQLDFGKYAGKVDAGIITAVFKAVPSQLSAVVDDSVKRFKFKDIYERKSRYQDFESAIVWLEKCHLVLKNYPVSGLPKSPLAAYKKDNMVKLFMLDVGLLHNMLGIGYKEIKQQSFEYKGYIAENFIQQELAALGFESTYSWHDARAEIEFIMSDTEGNIIPIEVKSGKRTKSRSLDSFKQKCVPIKTIKLTGTQGSSPLEKVNLVYPLYYVAHAIRDHINSKDL